MVACPLAQRYLFFTTPQPITKLHKFRNNITLLPDLKLKSNLLLLKTNHKTYDQIFTHSTGTCFFAA